MNQSGPARPQRRRLPKDSGREPACPDLALLALTTLALVLCWFIARPFVTSLARATALAGDAGHLASPIAACLTARARPPHLWPHMPSILRD